MQGNGFEVVGIRPIDLTEWTAPKFRWHWHDRISKALKRGHVLVESDHGMGKTLTGMIITKEEFNHLPMWYVSSSFGMERSTFEGQWYPRNGEHGPDLVATDGYVASAIVGDGLLVIDEFFRTPQDIQSALFAGMDSHRGLYTIAYRGATIKVGPNFRVLAFTNPPSPMYPEVEIADRALLSRFGSIIRVRFPDGYELARYMAHLKFPKENLVQTINFILKIRQAYDKGDLDNFLSPRDIMFFGAALQSGLKMDEALEDVFLGKFATRYEEAVRGFWKMHQPSKDKPEPTAPEDPDALTFAQAGTLQGVIKPLQTSGATTVAPGTWAAQRQP